MINSARSHTEDLRGHTFMTSNVRQSSKCSSKFLPLSIENILGRVDSQEKSVDEENSDTEPQKCDRDNAEDDVEIDIEGEESSKLEESREDHGTQVAEKQSPSYTAIIAQAILSSPDKKTASWKHL